MNNEIMIVIATESKDKIDGITKAFNQIFPDQELKIYSAKSESNVPEQPFGQETYDGAKNRVDFIIKKYKDKLQGHIKYYVGCEAGIEDRIPGQYFSQQVVCIYCSKEKKYFYGIGSSWSIPTKNIEEVRENNLDTYLRSLGCDNLTDLIDGKYISRGDAVKEGVMGALASVKSYEKGKIRDDIRQEDEEVVL